MKKYDWFVIIAIAISPVLLNYVILGFSIGAMVFGSTDGWLGFYGNIIGSLIALYLLFRTRIWNIEDNAEVRKKQYDFMQYQYKKECLDNLRKRLDENYQILDYQSATLATFYVQVNEYDKALSLLLQLNRNIEMQGYKFDLYSPNSEQSEERRNYVETYNKALIEYGNYINVSSI